MTNKTKELNIQKEKAKPSIQDSLDNSEMLSSTGGEIPLAHQKTKEQEFNLSEERKDIVKFLLECKDEELDISMINVIVGMIQGQDREFIRRIKEYKQMPEGRVIVMHIEDLDELSGKDLK